MATTEDANVHPWRIYGEEYKVPESKMGKGSEEEDKERPMNKSVEALSELGKSVAPPSPIEEGTDLLKACKACMGKGGESGKKAYLGELAISEKPGAKPKFTGEGAMKPGASYGQFGGMKPGKEKVVAQQESGAMKPSAPLKKEGGPQAGVQKGTPIGIPGGGPASMSVEKAGACPKCGKEGCPCAGQHAKGEGECKCPVNKGGACPCEKSCMAKSSVGCPCAVCPMGAGGVEKAMTSRALPRIPPGMRAEMVRRNAQSVMTRGNSRFAKDIHTGPLTGEVIEMVEGDAARRSGRQEVFKACDGCGRRYKLFKGMDGGCPTCKINKSTYCSGCGSQLVKGHGGSARCPLCG
jgi:hypothetical protein